MFSILIVGVLQFSLGAFAAETKPNLAGQAGQYDVFGLLSFGPRPGACTGFYRLDPDTSEKILTTAKHCLGLSRTLLVPPNTRDGGHPDPVDLSSAFSISHGIQDIASAPLTTFIPGVTVFRTSPRKLQAREKLKIFGWPVRSMERGVQSLKNCIYLGTSLLYGRPEEPWSIGRKVFCEAAPPSEFVMGMSGGPVMNETGEVLVVQSAVGAQIGIVFFEDLTLKISPHSTYVFKDGIANESNRIYQLTVKTDDKAQIEWVEAVSPQRTVKVHFRNGAPLKVSSDFNFEEFVPGALADVKFILGIDESQ